MNMKLIKNKRRKDWFMELSMETKQQFKYAPLGMSWEERDDTEEGKSE